MDKRNKAGNESNTEEYRLVRVDKKNVPDNDETVDLIEVASEIIRNKKILVYAVIVCVFLGLIFAFGSNEEFISEVKLIPESHQTNTLGGLSGIARQFGIGGRAELQSESFPPDLFPDVVRSVVVMQSIMKSEVPVPRADTTVTLYTYLTEIHSASIGDYFLRYTVYLPFTLRDGIRNLFGSSDDESLVRSFRDGDQELIRMNKDEWEVIESLKDRITIRQSVETGIVHIQVKMPDPVLSAVIANRVVEFLKEYIINYRTEKTRRDVEFISERFSEAKQRFEETQEQLALFRDENRGQLTQLARTREQRLESEYNLAFSLYSTLAERYEEARIKLQEDTPVVVVLEPPAIPVERSEPKRMIILLVSVFMGLVIGICWIILRLMYNGWINNMKARGQA